MSSRKKSLAYLVFGDYMDIPVEDEYEKESNKKQQKAALTWEVGLRETGGKMQPDKCFCKMVDFYWSGGQRTYKKNPFRPQYQYLMTKLLIYLFILKTSEAVKPVGVWQLPNNT